MLDYLFERLPLMAEPVFALIIPSSRFFLLYLLSAMMIGFAVLYFRQPKEERSISKAVHALFPEEVLLHPSARLDYVFAFVNMIVRIFLLSLIFLSTAATTGLAADAMTLLFGANTAPTEPGLIAIALFTIIAFLATDFGLFFAHWLEHKVPFFWEFHKVHHSAEVLTPITVQRMHPVDVLVNNIVPAIVLGVCNGVFYYLYAGPVAAFSILGLNALYFLMLMIGYHLRHSHVWVMYPKPFREHISSPALHHIHHSNDPRHYDKNFARTFTIWDRIAGTLYIPEEEEKLVFGLDEPEQDKLQTVSGLYFSPFKSVWRKYFSPSRAGHLEPGE
ncbi:MAG: sterol desaturase family protein [Pseudomonadota bacterium]